MGVHAAENNMNGSKQPGPLIVFPPLRPVKTHWPSHKRPLTTAGDFSFQPRLRTAAHNGTNTRSFRSQHRTLHQPASGCGASQETRYLTVLSYRVQLTCDSEAKHHTRARTHTRAEISLTAH